MAALFIPIKPKAKQSARLGKYGVYQSEDIVKHEALVKNAFREWAIASRFRKIEGAVYARVIFMMPKGKDNTKDFPTQRPDTDNLEKMLWDALNGEAYHDDCQIVGKSVDKMWMDGEAGYTIELYDMEREP